MDVIDSFWCVSLMWRKRMTDIYFTAGDSIRDMLKFYIIINNTQWVARYDFNGNIILKYDIKSLDRTPNGYRVSWKWLSPYCMYVYNTSE